MQSKLHPPSLRGTAKTIRAFYLSLAIIIALSTAVFPSAGQGTAMASAGVSAYLPITVWNSNGSNAPTAGATYYVDCASGKDTNNGTSLTTAWKSLVKANSAKLLPGDKLLFKRGCTWYGTLKAYWNGTATQMITLGAYGSGNMPVFQNVPADLSDKYHNSVDISGSYQIIEYLEVKIVNPPVLPGCLNNPIGFYIGFNFRNPNNLANGGSYNLLRFSKASGHTAGAHTQTNTHHNQILRSTFTENRVMNVLTPISVGASDDIGAWGILLKGNNHEVGYNYFSNNNAYCTYDTPPQGNSIEIYEGKNNSIHHNRSVNDRDFSELGGSAAIKSDNNSFVYNLVISSIRDSHFIIARGSGNMYGPTFRTKLYHNTVYYTGAESQGIICHAGCSSDIVSAHNNIIWAEWKAAYADGHMVESNNIYWNSTGTPFLQFSGFTMSSASRMINPMFINPSQHNFHLNAASPAVNAGMAFSWGKDLDDVLVPQGGINDLGAYEFKSP